MPYKKLLPQKRKFIELLKLSPLTRPEFSFVKKELGISKATYYRWCRNKEILDLVSKETSQDIDIFLPDVREILLKKALQGEMNAVKLFLQRYDKGDTLEDDETLTPDKIMEIIQNAKKEQQNKKTNT